MGQAIISHLRVNIVNQKGQFFLRKKFKNFFENDLAKAFFNEKELKTIFKETGKYINLKDYDYSRTD